jgi:hypothetical protein
LLTHPKVSSVVAHLCQFGMVTVGKDGERVPAKKATRFMSSSKAVLEMLSKRCDRSHTHQHLVNGRAKAAAIYPPALCRAILRGIAKQRRLEGEVVPNHILEATDKGCAIYNLQGKEEEGERLELSGDAEFEELEHERDALAKNWTCVRAPQVARALNNPDKFHADGQAYYDNITGELLPPDLVLKARKEEIDFMLEWRVWDEVPVSRSWQVTGKGPLGGRWVDVNKGDTATPNVRCRYVAKEIAYARNDDFFAAMPPLEALRLLVSHAATGRTSGVGGKKILVIDARKAHLHATTVRDVFVELPPEIRRPGVCARLRRCLYGTRDAPARWEAFLAAELKKHGFSQGVASPCCFCHGARDLRCVVHGDDFVFVGPDAELVWVQERMQESFLVKVVGRLGGDQNDLKEIRVLNRILRWTPAGISYEADPRHAELLVRDMPAAGPAVRTPGVKAGRPTGASVPEKEEEENKEEFLGEEETRQFRSGAARANYLAMDRPDLAFATKELCRRMTAPRVQDMAALARVARYLASEPRLVYQYDWQGRGGLRVYVDTDFAGCLKTRKSTSGGCALAGSHLVKHWSSTQKVVTLSSGEAELAGIVKGAAEAIGLKSLAADLGIHTELRVYADSSAAIGICRRSGIGKVRHLATGQLWVQERLRAGDFALYKIPGSCNPADALTKNVSRETADKHLTAMGLRRDAGRAESAPNIVEY